MSDAVAALGATITINSTPIEEVRDISGPEFTLDMVDVTSHDSPNGYEEKKPTIKRLGDITFDMAAVPGATGQDALVSAYTSSSEDTYVLTLLSGIVITFEGCVTQLGVSAAVTDVDMLSVGISVTTLTSFEYGS
jgi:hypothetical protein